MVIGNAAYPLPWFKAYGGYEYAPTDRRCLHSGRSLGIYACGYRRIAWAVCELWSSHSALCGRAAFLAIIFCGVVSRLFYCFLFIKCLFLNTSVQYIEISTCLWYIVRRTVFKRNCIKMNFILLFILAEYFLDCCVLRRFIRNCQGLFTYGSQADTL